jgi:hypothetical protein
MCVPMSRLLQVVLAIQPATFCCRLASGFYLAFSPAELLCLLLCIFPVPYGDLFVQSLALPSSGSTIAFLGVIQFVGLSI